jgi:hypothetical protein
MQPVRKLVIPAVLAFVVLGTTLALSSCGDDDTGPVADSEQGDAPDDGGTPDQLVV